MTQRFRDQAHTIELALAALDYIEEIQRLQTTASMVLNAAAWCLRYWLFTVNESDQSRS